jgi:hypothetical protein
LGLGMLSAMPSSAAAATPTAVTVGTIPTAQVGVVNTTPVTVTFPKGLASDTFSINVRVTSAPAGSQFRSLTTNLVAGVAATGNTIAAKLTVTQSSTATGLLATAAGTALTDSVTVSNTYTSSTATAAAGAASFNINLTPDVAGSYTILVSTHSETSNVIVNSGAGYPYTAGDASASYTVSTGSTAASVVLASVAPSTGIAGAATGMLFKATIKDAAGAAAQLGVNETIGFALTSGAGTVTVVGIAATSGADIGSASATYAATSANFTNGVGYFRFTNSAAETAVITATGAGLLASTVTGTLSFVTKTETSASGAVITDSTAQAAAIALGTGGHKTVTGTYASTASRAATSHSYKVTYGTPATIVDGTTSYDAVNVVDTSGKITGIVGGTYTAAVAISAATTTLTSGDTAALSFTATLSTAGNSFTATIGGSTLTVSSATAAVTTITAVPAGPVRQIVGGSTAVTFKVVDQFGAPVATEALSVTTAGRNASTSATALVTDAWFGYIHTC